MKRELWLRLRQYNFAELVPPHLTHHVRAAFGGPDPSTRAFASKVARKHEWSTEFSLVALEEYKKFVFLGVTSDFIVTPPAVIDKVWHEHLLFSRAYREFCEQVLERNFDHNPELLPVPDQTDTYHAQYEATLRQYLIEFNVAPPHAIWGRPKFRLANESLPKRRVREHVDGIPVTAEHDTPLHMLFAGTHGNPGGAYMPEFGGGGGFSGAGGGQGWQSDASELIEMGGDAPDTGDSSGGDSGGDGGGSGCSSGCGGGD